MQVVAHQDPNLTLGVVVEAVQVDTEQEPPQSPVAHTLLLLEPVDQVLQELLLIEKVQILLSTVSYLLVVAVVEEELEVLVEVVETTGAVHRLVQEILHQCHHHKAILDLVAIVAQEMVVVEEEQGMEDQVLK